MQVQKGVDDFFEHGTLNDDLIEIILQTGINHLLKVDWQDHINKEVICNVCNAFVGNIMLLMYEGTPVGDLKAIVIAYCLILDLAHDDVCEAMVDQYIVRTKNYYQPMCH